MELEGSLLYSQEPTTGSYPESDLSVHTFPLYFPKIHSNIIFPSAPRSSVWSSPFRFLIHQYFMKWQII